MGVWQALHRSLAQREIGLMWLLLFRWAALILALAQSFLIEREIAAELGLAVKTVEAHVHSILRKLRQPSRRALLVWAQRHRITEYAPSKTPSHCRFPW